MKKNINILIPNASSARNLGDLAILEALFNLIKSAGIKTQVVVHATDSNIHKKLHPSSAYSFTESFYTWAIFKPTHISTRIGRMLQLCILLICAKGPILHTRLPLDEKLKKMHRDYNYADIVFFSGGGYFRSKKCISQSLNLMMLLYPLVLAKIMKKKILFGPMSFGPFAYPWQESITSFLLKNVELISARENISYQKLLRHDLKNVILTTDLAFLLPKKELRNGKRNYFRIGITLRNWFDEKEQSEFEQDIVFSLVELSRKITIVIVPIVQVHSDNFGDHDKEVTERVVKKLKESGIKVIGMTLPHETESALRVYGQLDLLLGMRMHSNILALVQNVPVIALAYEYKTEGILQSLGLQKYCMKSEELQVDKLTDLLFEVNKKNSSIKQFLTKNLSKIQMIERKRWKHILRTSV